MLGTPGDRNHPAAVVSRAHAAVPRGRVRHPVADHPPAGPGPAVPRTRAGQASVRRRPPPPDLNRSITRTSPSTANGGVPGTVSRLTEAPLVLADDAGGEDELSGWSTDADADELAALTAGTGCGSSSRNRNVRRPSPVTTSEAAGIATGTPILSWASSHTTTAARSNCGCTSVPPAGSPARPG